MERDKITTLLEAMGYYDIHFCVSGDVYCKENEEDSNRFYFGPGLFDWIFFGKLWEWAQDQEWWWIFYGDKMTEPTMDHRFNQCNLSLIHPDRFANAVYEFLKERR